jgi:hypothetical protein
MARCAIVRCPEPATRELYWRVRESNGPPSETLPTESGWFCDRHAHEAYEFGATQAPGGGLSIEQPIITAHGDLATLAQ